MSIPNQNIRSETRQHALRETTKNKSWKLPGLSRARSVLRQQNRRPFTEPPGGFQQSFISVFSMQVAQINVFHNLSRQRKKHITSDDS